MVRVDMMPYYPVADFDNVSEIKDLFCYILEGYKYDGFSVLILDNGDICKFGEFDGSDIRLDGDHPMRTRISDYFNTWHEKIVLLMGHSRIDQLQLYICIHNDQLLLVDVQTAANKMVGPGMLKDVFGKIMTTPVVRSITVLDNDVIGLIKKGSGSYNGDLIIKPSKFRAIIRDNQFRPLYAAVRR